MGSMLIVKSAYCPDYESWAKEQGIWHSYTETPQVGDLALFDFSGKHSSREHIGIVKSVGTSTITTIEGNTGSSNANGGAVMERQRSVVYVTCYIRPRYNASQTAKKLLEIAQSQVGTEESPANSNNVKYNTWFYGQTVSGSEYPWCAAFVAWCFAALAGEIGVTTGTATVSKVACTVAAYILKNGATGAGVRTLQAALTALGYGCGGVDGEYGAQTMAAVKRYQAANGLAADGEVGALTWARLLAI